MSNITTLSLYTAGICYEETQFTLNPAKLKRWTPMVGGLRNDESAKKGNLNVHLNYLDDVVDESWTPPLLY
jgi:hypothetical protein